MRQMLKLSAIGMVISLSLSSFANAKRAFSIATPSQQAVQAEAIVVGKVTEIEKELSMATPFATSKEKIGYRIGVIQITESIQGVKGLTTVRVGWQATAELNSNSPIREISIARAQHAQLSESQEGCFFLTKHHEGDFYIMQLWGMPLDKKTADYDKQFELVKKIVDICQNPMVALKAKEAVDRQFAASLLIQKYRTPVTYRGKELNRENIDADESQLIMQIMSVMDWDQLVRKDATPGSLNQLFGMLGIQPGEHGFNPPKFQPNQADFAKTYGEYVTRWIKDNADQYRIQRFVAAK